MPFSVQQNCWNAGRGKDLKQINSRQWVHTLSIIVHCVEVDWYNGPRKKREIVLKVTAKTRRENVEEVVGHSSMEWIMMRKLHPDPSLHHFLFPSLAILVHILHYPSINPIYEFFQDVAGQSWSDRGDRWNKCSSCRKWMRVLTLSLPISHLAVFKTEMGIGKKRA